MKYNYRNKKTNSYIKVLNRSTSVSVFGFAPYGHGIDEITTKYVKIELVKDGSLYSNSRDYFDQYKSNLYISKNRKTYDVFMIPIEEFIKSEVLEEPLEGYRGIWYNYNEVTLDRGVRPEVYDSTTNYSNGTFTYQTSIDLGRIRFTTWGDLNDVSTNTNTNGGE